MFHVEIVACMFFFMYYGARSGALRAPELAESPVLLILWGAIATNSDSQTCPKITPKLLQNGSPNGSKIASKSIPEPLKELLELSWNYLRVILSLLDLS